jgi:hypothetical protein
MRTQPVRVCDRRHHLVYLQPLLKRVKVAR